MQPIKGFRRNTPEDTQYAAELLAAGEPIDTVRARLQERGLARDGADVAINEAIIGGFYHEAVAMLEGGMKPRAVRDALVEKGCDPQTAAAMVDELTAGRGGGVRAVRKVVGGLVIAVGVGLWIGNLTGWFPTFPFAGIITIFIGAAIAGSK